MDPQVTALLYNLLGWTVLGICVLFGLAHVSSRGLFQSLWLLVTSYFALRIADTLAQTAAGWISGPLNVKGITAEAVGYWIVFLAVYLIGLIWLKLLDDPAVAIVPLLEQLLTPVAASLVGLVYALAVFQTAWCSPWLQTHFPGPMQATRSWLSALDQGWFPTERVKLEDPKKPAAKPVAPRTPSFIQPAGS